MIRVLFSLLLFFFCGSTLAQPQAPDSTAVLSTNLGQIRLKLRRDIAPNTVNHFVELAKGKKEYRDATSGKTISNTPFYNNLKIHRIHPDLGIHTGCQWGTGHGWPGFTIPFEKQPDSVKFDRPYLVGFATIPGRPNTGGSQFFITTKANSELNGKYVLFGEVVAGAEVVSKIAKSKKDALMRPLQKITLKDIRIE